MVFGPSLTVCMRLGHVREEGWPSGEIKLRKELGAPNAEQPISAAAIVDRIQPNNLRYHGGSLLCAANRNTAAWSELLKRSPAPRKRHKIKAVALLAGTPLSTSDALLQSLRRHALPGSGLRNSGIMNAAFSYA
jgi:hypothetical protein